MSNYNDYVKAVLIKILKDYYSKYNKIPDISDLICGGYTGDTAYKKYFGSFKAALKCAGLPIPIDYRTNPTEYKQFLLDEINRYVEETGEIPTTRKMGGEWPSITAYQHYFGSWNNALKMAGYTTKYEWNSKHKLPVEDTNTINKMVFNGYITPTKLEEF